jgi:hypothetical protein
MPKPILLTEHQNEFIRGCLEACGCDDAGEGERLIALLENTTGVLLLMPDTWEVRDATN